MTKVLLDPIYTQDPSKCASAYKMKKVAEHLLATSDDTFIYWRVPKDMTEEDQQWLPVSDRIKYLPSTYYLDRHKEYHYVRESWNDDITFRGHNWDTDLVITNRVPLIPLIRLQMYRPGHRTMEWSRKIVAFEDMPVMSFKHSVPVPHESTQDRQTLAGYLAADATAICAYWEKKEIIQVARKYYAPAMIKQLSETIHEATPIRIEKTKLKSREFVAGSSSRPFVIGFAGRMVKGHNFDVIFEVMKNHWIYRAGEDRKVECVISTVSKTTGRVDVPSFIELKRLGREEFWDLMINRVDVGIFMSPEEDYSLSLLEPLILGTPFVVYRAKWSVASLGEDYPFFVSGENEAYAVIRDFYTNYPKEYAKFAAWSKSKFQPLLQSRNAITHESVVDQVLAKHKEQLEAHYRKVLSAPSDLVQLIARHAEESGGRFHFQTSLNELEKKGELRHLAAKMRDIKWENKSISFSTDFNELRLALQAFGYKDASILSGDLIKR